MRESDSRCKNEVGEWVGEGKEWGFFICGTGDEVVEERVRKEESPHWNVDRWRRQAGKVKQGGGQEVVSKGGDDRKGGRGTLMRNQGGRERQARKRTRMRRRGGKEGERRNMRQGPTSQRGSEEGEEGRQWKIKKGR